MHCVQFEMRLDELLDDRAALDSDWEVLEHARECRECGELLAGHEALLAAHRCIEPPTVGPDFAVRVAAKVARQNRPSQWRSWMWAAPALAAGFLVAVGVWRVLNERGVGDRSPLDGAAQQLPAMAGQLAVSSKDGYWRIFAATEKGLRDRITPEHLEWVDQMADGLKPVADSMSAALHALRRTLPGGDAGTRSTKVEPFSLGTVAMLG